MKRHTVIAILKGEHSDLEIDHFAMSFIVKVCKELEAADGDSTTLAKHKKHDKRLNVIRNTILYVSCRKVSIRKPESQCHCQEAQIFKAFCGNTLWLETYGACYMWCRDENSSLLSHTTTVWCAKKNQVPGILWSPSDGKNFNQGENVNQSKVSWLFRDDNNVPTVVHTVSGNCDSRCRHQWGSDMSLHFKGHCWCL